jgi:23S rRNA (adenine2030-N6)-methyltransferase
MNHYDHRVHAGNAGDVWKHFLLLEAANHLLEPGGSLVYAESHAGRPEYVLRAPGDWEGGIGKIWPLLPSLRDFSYFKIMADLNSASPSPVQAKQPFPGSNLTSEHGPISGPILKPIAYPGSTCLIYELAQRRGANLQARVWDDDADVAGSWEDFITRARSTRSIPQAEIVFHQGDGFEGVLSYLCSSPPGLLFIDPAYIDPKDAILAKKLLQRAKDLGWIVLWWYLMDMQTAPLGLDRFELRFSQAGLNGGKWKGAVVAFAGEDGDRYDRLISHINQQIRKFFKILNRKIYPLS